MKLLLAPVLQMVQMTFLGGLEAVHKLYSWQQFLKLGIPRSGLKFGEVILVIQVMFCLCQADLTKYLGLTQILHWITCTNNGVWS